MKRSKLRYLVRSVIIVAFMCLLLTPALAHVPAFEEGGISPETATYIEDPSKSRVLYGQLSGEDIRYYSFEMGEGERISLGLIVPVEEDHIYVADLTLMGPGLPDERTVPENVEVSDGYGTKVFTGIEPESATYEGFTPSAFYSLVRADLQAPESGTYYVAVSSVEGEGNYGVVLGYKERFSLTEWLSIPLNQIRTYRWEGQSLPFIFFPLGITLAAGILIILRKKEDASGFKPSHWAGTFAGLFFLGTGLSLIFQMLYSLSKSSYSSEIIVTVFLALASIGLGIIALILSLRNEGYNKSSTRKKIYFFILGILGLLLWAGLFIGPIFAFEAAALPWNTKR